jgi:TonB family protein
MKTLFTLWAVACLFTGAVAAADQAKGAPASGNLKYRIEYGKIPGDVTLVSRIKPNYPKELRAAGVQGEVIVSFVVEGNGSVSTAYGDCPQHPELAKLAEDAVRRWKFVGTYSRPGVFTSISTWVRIKFRLVESAAGPAR